MKASQLSVRRRPPLESRAEHECIETIEDRIIEVRGHLVLPDVDLARICGVTVTSLLDCVRDRGPFPGEFCFQPERYELDAPVGHGVGGRFPPFVFTEHGALLVVMLLDPARGIDIGARIVRAFRCFRQVIGNFHLEKD